MTDEPEVILYRLIDWDKPRPFISEKRVWLTEDEAYKLNRNFINTCQSLRYIRDDDVVELPNKGA